MLNMSKKNKLEYLRIYDKEGESVGTIGLDYIKYLFLTDGMDEEDKNDFDMDTLGNYSVCSVISNGRGIEEIFE